MKRITVISENLAEPWDEGIKNFALSLGRALGRDNKTQLLNVDRDGKAGISDGVARRIPGSRMFASGILRDEIRSFSPDAVLYVPSPSSTLGSFVRAHSLRRHVPSAAHGMVALIPRRHNVTSRPIIRQMAPDVVFVPSYKSLLYLHRLSLSAEITPVGVDTERFRVARPQERLSLRDKHGVRRDAYVYLHVGHLSNKRNLTRLIGLKQLPDVEVVVVGSTSTPGDESLRSRLESAGIDVVRERVPVEEYYRLCDCYVFPVEDEEGCVEIPLSVFEALASGTPVLSTAFGGLRDFLQPGGDLVYFQTDEQMLAAAKKIRAAGAWAVRPMDEFTWDKVAAAILDRLHR